LTPTIEGKMHHFVNAGLYDGVFVMQDTETKTLWNHITGEALYGPLTGRQLGRISNLLQMNVKLALALDSDMQVAMSDRPFFGGARPSSPDNPNATLGERFVPTLGTEDPRRPRMDVGLGVWTDKTRRYYPMETIRQRGEALIDEIDGRKVLVYIEPESATPAAIYIDATGATWRDKQVHLDNGAVVRSSVLFGRSGQAPLPIAPLE
jgi:hypothetical protein